MFKKIISITLVLSALLCSLGLTAFADAKKTTGDVDGDGKITTTDFLRIKHHLLSGEETADSAFANADMDGDGVISSVDYLAIKLIWTSTQIQSDKEEIGSVANQENGSADTSDNETKVEKAITLYVPNNNHTELKTYRAYFDGTAQGIISALSDMGALPENTKVLSFEIKGQRIIMDLSSEFGEALKEARSFEGIIVGSLANTLLNYYGIEELVFTIEGEILETGLNVYDFPITYTEALTIYVPTEDGEDLITIHTQFDGTINGMISALVSHNVLYKGTKVNSFKLSGNTAKIDFSKEFGTALNEARTFAPILLSSVANTIIDFYDIEQLFFTVEGKTFETGLTIYDFPIEYTKPIVFYIPSDINEELVPVKSYFNGTIYGIVSSYVAYGLLPEGTKINSYKIHTDTISVDFSKEFGIAINEARTAGVFLLRAIANTIIENFDVKYFTFTVEGETLETGLDIYDSPIEFLAKFIIYLPTEDQTDLVPYNTYCDKSAQGIISALISKNIFPAKTRVLSFKINGNTAVIDLSKEFAVTVNEGRTREKIILGTFTNSIIENFNVEYVSLTVEGETLETGLDVYDQPIEFIKKGTLWLPSEDNTHLVPQDIYYNGKIDGLVSALIANGILLEGTKVNSFETEGLVAKIDFSKEFGDSVKKDSALEDVILSSFVTSLVENFDVGEMLFTVEGEHLRTEVSVYDFLIRPWTSFKVFLPNKSRDGFIYEEIRIRALVQNIEKVLLSKVVLPEGTKILDLRIEGETAKVDLSKEFGIALNEARTDEAILLGAFSNTIIKHFGVDNLIFTVEGEVLETGLNVYDSPIEFMESVVIYTLSKDGSSLSEAKTFFDGSAEGLIFALKSHNVIPADASLLYFDKSRDTVLVDLSTEFGTFLNESRTTELLLVKALAYTFIEYYQVDYFEFTVDGEILETGLNVYDFPIEMAE